jgi:catalase
VERRHIVDAFVFELSRCDQVAVRRRMVAGLRNVDDNLARAVADGLGLGDLPQPLPAAREPIRDLAPSPALSILHNGPRSFAGRKLGVLVTDGADAGLIAGLRAAVTALPATPEFVAPTVGGIDASDGSHVVADRKLDGGPSVLYDAVAVLTTKDGAAGLAQQPAVRDFVADAYAHGKFIGYVDEAVPLFRAAGLTEPFDDGFVRLADGTSIDDFIVHCGQLRFWARTG